MHVGTLKQHALKRALLNLTCFSASVAGSFLFAPLSWAQSDLGITGGTSSDRILQLAPDSPFQDPDIIYLEADELTDDETKGTITAMGEVEGRYQDRTLRADRVVYSLETGRVIASGNVVLVDPSGSTQYAEKLELSDELEAGSATGFTARLPSGGLLAAAFVARGSEDGVELYNAYYTACKTCKEDGSAKKPTWRLKARKVTQNKDRNLIQYRDAVFELQGIPLFYTPFLSHPDPSAGRTSGWLYPFIGISGNKGINFRSPYFFALDKYSDLTLTPRIFQDVNPVLSVDYKRRFYSGEVNVNGSFTYAKFFDENGNTFDENTIFTNPDEAPLGRRLRSHFFANGLFDIDENWQWGFGAQAATDDLYLERYGLDEIPTKFGLYEADSRRLVSQAFVVGQDDNFRFSTSAFGFQSLRTSIFENATNPAILTVVREDDSILPIVAPKIELEHYLTDPIVGGRLKTFGDLTSLTREIGTDYTRATGGLDWNKSFITPGGIELKPFAQARYDYFEIEPDGLAKQDFSRTLGQTGVDIRWPFIRPGNVVDLIIEPRALITQNFGDGKIENFTTQTASGQTISLLQDSFDIDVDPSLLWSANKSTGFDFWQKGFRADVGASLIADWKSSRAHLFLGQSYAEGFDENFELGSGLETNKSDIVGLFELDINNRFRSTTRIRYDDDDNAFRRIDTGFSYTGSRLQTNWRYYRIDGATRLLNSNPNAPSQEVSGSATLRLLDNWSTRITAFRDIDSDITRRQSFALIYDDDCTRIEFTYTKDNNDLGIVGDDQGFGVRISLLSLGDFSNQ